MGLSRPTVIAALPFKAYENYSTGSRISKDLQLNDWLNSLYG